MISLALSAKATMSKRINATASSRLRQDYLRLMRDPVPYITATPLPSNILEWSVLSSLSLSELFVVMGGVYVLRRHYVVKGPEESPYEGVLTRHDSQSDGQADKRLPHSSFFSLFYGYDILVFKKK